MKRAARPDSLVRPVRPTKKGTRRGPKVWALALLLALFLGLNVASAQAATYTVTNNADSGAGSLRAALTSALAGDAIVFDASLAGATITLATALPAGKGVTFTNASDITVSYAPGAAGTYSGLSFSAAASVTGDLPDVSLSSTSTPTLRGISAASGLLTLEKLSGSVSVSGKGAAYGLYSTGGVSITNGISGSLTAATSSGTAYGIYSTSGAVSLGGLSGSLTASGTSAYGIYSSTQAISITGGVSGDISATGTSGAAYGLYVLSGAGITITGGISGTVTATNASGGSGAYGLYAPRAISISGGISGSVDATAGGNGNSFGLNSTTYALTLDGGLTNGGSVSATSVGTGTATGVNGGVITFSNGGIAGDISASAGSSGNAYGINASQSLSVADGISGTVTATTGTGTAAGLYTGAGGLSVGGISGSISATSTDNTTGTMTAATYGIRSTGPMSLGDLSGSVSASGPRAFAVDAGGSTTTSIGNISGTVSATSGGPGYYSCGINCIGMAAGIANSGTGTLTMGDITGSVSATSTGSEASGYRPYAVGLLSSASGALTTGNISGNISATASGSGGNAYGIYSTGTLTTGTVSGSISATANGDGTAAAVVATTGSNLTVSGTLSATNSGSGGTYAILNKRYDQDLDSWDETSGVDNVTLLSGARLLGKVDLSGGADTMTFNSSNVTISGLLDGGTGTDTLALTGSGSFSGYSITNFERLTKSGGGTWALNQNLNLGATGATTLSGGTLDLNAVLTSPTVTVASGATLSGTGTVVGDVTNSGAVAPGSSGGTLTVTGNYTQTSGSTLNISLSNTGCSLLDISGTANLNSGSGLSVTASLSPGYYSNGQSYTFLKAAGGITGSFDSTSMTGSTFLNFSLAETATEYQLVLSRTGYSTAAGTGNGYRAAQALDLAAVSPGSAMQSALALVDFASAGKSASMLDQLGPAAYGAMSRTALSSMRLFTNAANSQLLAAGQARGNAAGWNPSLADFSGLTGGAKASAAAQFADPQRIMAAGPLGLEPVKWSASDQNMYLVPIGTYTRQATGDDSTGYQGLTYGLTGGALIPVSGNFGMAVQLGYAHSALDYLNSSSTADIDHFVAGVFGMYAEDGYYGVANVQAGLAYNTMRRRVDFGTSSVTATGHPLTYTLGTGIDAGRDYELRQGVWAGPVAGLQAARMTTGGFTENGADALNLTVGQDTAYSLKSSLGLRLHSTHEADRGASVSTEFSLRWAHEFLDRSRDIRASFEGAPGISFTGVANGADADAILLGAGLTYKPAGHLAYFAKYTGEISGARHQAHSVMLGLGLAF